MQGKFTMGLIAQKEDEADREDRQMRFLALTKKIDASPKLLDTMILIAEKTSSAAGSSARLKISELTEKIELMLEELEGERKQQARVVNPIVMRVLQQALESIGVKIGGVEGVQKTSSIDSSDVMLSSINEDDSESQSELFNDNWLITTVLKILF